MRYLVLGFCVFATACTGTAPTAPTSSFSQVEAGAAPTEARGGSELPIKGNLQATEAVEGSLHHLSGSGHGAHLGRFTYEADIAVDEATGDGTGTVTWIAANGDRILAGTAGTVLAINFPVVSIRETQTITGGTGRFAGASGTVTLERSLDLFTGMTSGSFSGAINR